MPDRGPVRVLLIEDNDDDALLMLQELCRGAMRIDARRVDRQSQILAALDEGGWDIVLADNALPDMDLLDVLETLHRAGADMPVVVVTGSIGEENVAELMRRGVADVVLKTRLSERLAPVVRREVEQIRNRRAAEQARRRMAGVLAALSDAATWRDAMTRSLQHVALSFEAVAATVSQVTPGGYIEPIATWTQPQFAALEGTMRRTRRGGLQKAVITTGVPLLVDRLRERPNQDSLLARTAVAAGASALICQPLQVGEKRFGLTLLFEDDCDPLQEIHPELVSLLNLLQVPLLRKINEDDQHLLRTALDATRSGVVVWETAQQAFPDLPDFSLEGQQIVYANSAAGDLVGLDRRDLLGQTPQVLLDMVEDPAMAASVRRAVALGEPISLELRRQLPNGSPAWMELGITPVHNAERVTHFIAIETDVTGHRHAQQERLDYETSFRWLFESNPVPTWVYDVETARFLEVNTAAVKRYGWSRDTFLQRGPGDLLPQDQREEWQRLLNEAAGGQQDSIPGTHVTATGDRLSVQSALSRIIYRGRQAHLLVSWDVTEMEHARAALQHSHHQLAQLTQELASRTDDLVDAARLAGMGTWSLHLSPHRVQWSPETYAIFGRDPGTFDLEVESIVSCIHPDDREMFRSTYRAMMQDGGDRAMEFRIHRPSGETRILRELARVRRDSQGNIVGISGVIQDVTQQKAAQGALLHAERLKTIGQITGGIAHDFNNLLTVISLNLEAALDIAVSLPALADLLKPACHATRRSQELTEQLLSYGRKREMRPQAVDLWPLVETMRPLLTRAVGTRGTLRIHGQATRTMVNIDPGQFENALMNLVINARDALGEGGEIEVTIHVLQSDEPLETQPDVVPAGHYVRVRVSDTGSGIPADMLPRIFEPFFTTKPPGAGSGLGLSMVYGFVHQSDGCMAVASEMGVGTSIDLYFPTVG